MRRIRRWSMLAVLAWIIHVPAFAAQADTIPCDETPQAASLHDCQMCASCVASPVSAVRTAERDDNPVVLSSAWTTQFDQQALVHQTTMGTAVRRPLPLRVLYCRWLN